MTKAISALVIALTLELSSLYAQEKWPNLTRKMLEKGYSGAEIRKIYSGNLLRVMGAAENTSRRLRAAR